jgi:hypothetical protein
MFYPEDNAIIINGLVLSGPLLDGNSGWNLCSSKEIVPKTLAFSCTWQSPYWICTEAVQAELHRPLLPLLQVVLGLREHEEKVHFSDLR